MSRRRPPVGGWPDSVETIPMHQHPLDAPMKARAGQRIVTPDDPPLVRAWVTVPRVGDVQVAGEAVAWTAGAPAQVHVRYVDDWGRQGWVWVWANAVERR